MKKNCRGYQNNDVFITDMLGLLSLKMHREVMLTRALRGDDRQESFLGLFVSEDDISAILSELHGRMIDEFPEGDLLQARILKKEKQIQQALANTTEALPHQQLADIFALSQQDINILLLALAPEIDERFSRVYGYLHDDVSRKKLSGALASRLLKGEIAINGDDKHLSVRRILHADSPVIKFRLLRLVDDDMTPLLDRGLKMDNRVVNFLLGHNTVDDELVHFLSTPWQGDIAFTHDDCTDSAEKTAHTWLANPQAIILRLEQNADVDAWLSLFCGITQTGLLQLEWQRISQLDFSFASRLLLKAIREAHLSASILHLRNVNQSATHLLSWLSSMSTAVVVISTDDKLSQSTYPLNALEIHLPTLSNENHLLCWKATLGNSFMKEHQFQDLSQRYPLSVSAMADIGNIINSDDKSIEKLITTCRHIVGNKMQEVAQRVNSPFSFSDLILPPATTTSLRELVARQHNATQVLEDWGLSQTFSQSSGSATLFVGPSGTGKTMAAGVIANTLGLDMYRVDLAGVVSKYIGETEKNLDRIFNVACQSKIVLFIDEADALFGKRSEVKDAHDRYANIEVSYLLQKIEEHEGIVILASNFGQNIDEAFLRRFSLIVDFPQPKNEDRLRLWQRLNLTKAPLTQDVDLHFLAEKFELTGGHIKNCIMTAAFQAAAENTAISMLDLIRAVGKEYAKIGKPISKSNFGDYYSGIRRDVTGS